VTVEDWKSIFDIGTVCLTFLLFAFGAGALITGNVINARQSVQLRQFDKDLTAAKQRVESLRADNLRLEGQIQPRSLSLDQQRDIGNVLIPFKGRRVWVVVVSLNDPESYNFGQQLFAALKPAALDLHMSASSPTGTQYSPITETGVQVRWTGQQELANALYRALDKNGVRKLSLTRGEAPVSGPTDVLTKSVFVLVYPKPFDVLK
jgi:hypothetical protein